VLVLSPILNAVYTRVVLEVAVGFLFAQIALFSAEPARAQEQNGKVLVTASLISDVDSIQRGQKFRIGVLYRIEPGWHIYWRYPGDAGIPTKIAWQLPAGFKVHDLQWPIPTRQMEPGDLEVLAYSSEVLLFAGVEAPQSLPNGPIEIQAKSDWLVCEKSCIPGGAQLSLRINTGVNAPSPSAPIFEKYAAQLPKTLPAGLNVGFGRIGKNLGITVAGAPNGPSLDFFPIPPAGAVIGHVVQEGNQLSIPIEAELKPISRLDGVLVVGPGDHRQGYEINAATPAAGVPVGEVAQTATFLGILQALGLAMIGGLILNVMPCVLPVISLKIFGFVSEAGERPDKAFRLSTAFSLGILFCFTVLALIVILLRAAGTGVGWGFQFQDYRFIVLISCLVFAFALNLFGVYELSVSAQAAGRLAKLASGQGYGGAFFQGVFATILATPCTAPFLGTASAFAFAQPDWVTFLVFLFIGVGMASPYLVLAIKPNWLRYVPKPGRWMLRFKQFLGFLLIVTLLWLVWILGQMKGASAIISLEAILLVIAILAWIKGAFWTPLSSSRSRVLAGAAMLLVIMMAAGAYAFVTQPSQLAWQPFTKDSLEKALASGRPVFVEFTADWCIVCKTNERFAIDTPQVRREFARRNVVPLKADWTNGDPEITQSLKQHGRAGVPMYLVYPAGGWDQRPVVLPELITSQTVIDALRESD
jgi:thiol:disulfide interchange protein/DsbC/DsbD-like thiol-disulfide interchange protein